MADGTIGFSVSRSGTTLSGSKVYSGSSAVSLEETIADSVTDGEINLDLDISAITMFFMKSNKDILVEGNNGAGVAGSVALKANVPYIWTTDTYDTFKFTADLSAIFVTNASGATAILQIEALQDATP